MNFLEAQRCLLSILKLLGFFSYQVQRDGIIRKKSFRHLIYCIMINVLSHILFIGGHVIYAINGENYLSDGNHVSDLVMYLEFTAIELSFYFVLYGISVRRSSQIEFFEMILSIEQEISEFKFTRKLYNERLRKSSQRFIVIVIIFYTALLVYNAVVVPQNMFMVVMIEAFNFTMFSSLLIFITHLMENAAATIGNLFDELDWNLKHYITACPFHFHHKDVKNILKLHDQLVGSIAKFNEAFGVINLGIFVFIFGFITFEVYFDFSAVIFHAPDLILGLNVIGSIISFLLILISFCKFAFTCESVQEKVKLSLRILALHLSPFICRRRASVCT